MFFMAGSWLDEEDERLIKAVQHNLGKENVQGIVNGISWKAVAADVGTRDREQCRYRWTCHLSMSNLTTGVLFDWQPQHRIRFIEM